MKKKQKNLLALLSLMMTGGLFMTSCMDDNYDLSDIDGTVAVGSDEGITLPSNNSTTNITLSDLLDIDESESVTTDVDGNYQYEQSSTIDDVNDIKVDEVTITKESSTDIPAKIEIDPGNDYYLLPNGTLITDTYNGSITHNINTFNYEGDQPKEVISLSSTDISGTVKLTINFDGSLVGGSSDLPKLIQKFDLLTIEFPSYLEIESEATQENNKLIFTDVPTNQNLVIQATLKKADFSVAPDAENKLAIENDKIIMKGGVKIQANYNTVQFNKGDIDFDKLTINSVTNISEVTIKSATGKFDPDITIENSTIDLDDLPDFMTDDEVVVDLYNPQIIFTANSQLPLPGKINAKLKAKKNGSVIKTVTIPEFLVEQNKANKILIARRNENIPTDLTQPAIIVPDLSEIIKDVPDNIELSIEAKADSENDYDFELGTSYSITDINYIIHAPLSFGDEALIVYNDTIDGWAEDLEDIYLTDNAKVEATFDITNNVPAKLTLEATPIDAKGNDIDNMLNIENPPTVDKGVNNGVKFTITQKNKDALKKLDGLRLKIKGKPIDNTTLNEKTQTIKIENISIKVIGKVVIEDNKD